MNNMELDLNIIHDEVIDGFSDDENVTLESFYQTTDPTDDVVDDSTEIDNSDVINYKDFTNKFTKKIKSKERTLSNEELVFCVQNGIEAVKSKELLVHYNSGIVYNEARKCTCKIPFEDKVQYGFLGLLEAIDKFNTKYDSLFVTYATTVVHQHMYRWGNREARPIEIPEYLSSYNIKVQKYIQTYFDENGVNPTEEQISKGTSIDVRIINKIMNNIQNVMSIETPVSEDGTLSLQDIITADNSDYKLTVDTVFSTEIEIAANKILEKLNPAEQRLFCMVNGLNGFSTHAFDEIIKIGYVDANGYRINSKATLSRRYSEVLTKVKRIIDRDGIMIKFE